VGTLPYPYQSYSMSDRFLAISPYGGFNNQLDHLYYQIGWAQALGWTLVLPKFSGSHHTHDRGFFGSENYLNIYEISKLVKVISWEDFLVLCENQVDAVVALDQIRKNPDGYRTYEIMSYYNITYKREVVLQNLNERLQGSKLRNLFKKHNLDQDRCVMTNGIPRYGEFDKVDLSENSYYFQVRNSVRMAPYVLFMAESWVRLNLENKPFLAIHYRRGDFASYCRNSDIAIYPYVHQAKLLTTKSIRKINLDENRPGCYPDLEDAIRNITYVAQQCNLKNLFLSTNAETDELNQLFTRLPDYRVYRYSQSDYEFVPNMDTIMDISINSMATCFLGNKYSSLTFTILTKRRQLAEKKPWSTSFLF